MYRDWNRCLGGGGEHAFFDIFIAYFDCQTKMWYKKKIFFWWSLQRLHLYFYISKMWICFFFCLQPAVDQNGLSTVFLKGKVVPRQSHFIGQARTDSRNPSQNDWRRLIEQHLQLSEHHRNGLLRIAIPRQQQPNGTTAKNDFSSPSLRFFMASFLFYSIGWSHQSECVDRYTV